MRCEVTIYGWACNAAPYCTFRKRIFREGHWKYESLVCCMDHAKNRSRVNDVYDVTLFNLEGQKRNFSTEESPYWEWAEKNSLRGEDGDIQEYARANPDRLEEKKGLSFVSKELGPEEESLLARIKQSFHLFSFREGQILNLLCYRGMTKTEIAQFLDIKPQTVESYIVQVKYKLEKALLKRRGYPKDGEGRRI